MNSLVCQEGAGAGEGLPTLLTRVGLLAGVNPLVYLEGTRKGESLPTLLTNVRLLSAVILLVPSKRAGRSEHFPTLLTFIVLFSAGCPVIILTGSETPRVFLTVTSFRFLLSVSSFLLPKGCGRVGGALRFFVFIQLFPTFRFFVFMQLFPTFLNVILFVSWVRMGGDIQR